MSTQLSEPGRVATDDGSDVPACGGSVARRVRMVALLLLAVQVVWRGWLIGGREYFNDDFLLLSAADGSSLFSPDYLFQDYDGQFVPGLFLLVGLVERVAPLEWWPAAVLLIALQLLASLALLRLLRVLLGDRPLLLVPLVLGLFSPLTLGSTVWFAAALNSLPLQIGLAWFVADAVLLARTGSRRYAVRATAAFALTALFYVKAVLLPWIGIAVAVLVLLRDGERAPVATSLRRGRPLWLGSLAVTAAWAIAFVLTRTRSPASGVDVGEVVETVLTGYRVLATSVLGGPSGWAGGSWPGAPLARVPMWTVVLGAALLLAAFAWTYRYRRGAVAVWALVVGAVTVGLVLAGTGRSALGLGDVLPLAARYYAVESVLLPVALALLATLPARRPRSRRAPGRAALLVPATAAVTALVGVVALSSTVGYARAWETDPTAAYLAAVRESLSAAGPAPLLDQQLPADVMWQLHYPANLISRALTPLEDRPPVEAWTSDLRALDDDGHLRPATVQPGVSLTGGPGPGCGWAIAPGDGTEIPLTGSIFDWEWTARLDYVADRDGSIVVTLGDGDAVRAPIRAGSHTVFLRLGGGGAALRVTARTPGLALCVPGGVVGDVVLR